jgi:hypothetical protein
MSRAVGAPLRRVDQNSPRAATARACIEPLTFVFLL